MVLLISCIMTLKFYTSGLISMFTFIVYLYLFIWASQVALVVKNLPANAGDAADLG